MRTTHTYAVMEVGRATFEDIAGRFKKLGPDYDEVFVDTPHGAGIHLHGVAIVQEAAPAATPSRGKPTPAELAKALETPVFLAIEARALGDRLAERLRTHHLADCGRYGVLLAECTYCATDIALLRRAGIIP